jgi:polysaccharide deacetylase 2 family uncharacterized protein YibQ
VLHLKQILKGLIKKWGYEYGLVAGGAVLGLLIVVIVGSDQQPAPSHIVPPTKPSLDVPPSVTPPKQNAPVAAAKNVETARQTPKVEQSSARDARQSSAPVVQKIREDPPAWKRFAAVHGPALGRKMIAVIIDDMGLDKKRSARAVGLPGPMTLSYLTYARTLKGQAATAREAGHEIMIHVPMEPDDSSAYAGPKSIRRDLSDGEIKRRLDWALGRLDEYVGINNHMGSRYTTYRPGMAVVLAEVKRRGLLFIDSRTSSKSVSEVVATDLSVPFAARDVFLDDDPSRENVRLRLVELEKIATKKGYAIAIGHPYDTTLGVLEEWLPTLSSRGFVLVPVSAIVRHRIEKR